MIWPLFYFDSLKISKNYWQFNPLPLHVAKALFLAISKFGPEAVKDADPVTSALYLQAVTSNQDLVTLQLKVTAVYC